LSPIIDLLPPSLQDLCSPAAQLGCSELSPTATREGSVTVSQGSFCHQPAFLACQSLRGEQQQQQVLRLVAAMVGCVGAGETSVSECLLQFTPAAGFRQGDAAWQQAGGVLVEV